MLNPGSSTSQTDSFGEESLRRAASPLVSKEEGYERLKKQTELAERAAKLFATSEDVIDKFESVNKANEDFGRWALTTEVESKMNTFKETMASDPSTDKNALWELIQADLIISYQQMKMNEILLKTNADLKSQVALARDIFSRTQTEAVTSLRTVVKDALELVKSREEEAGHWKMAHHDMQGQVESLRKELKTLQKKTDDTQKKLAATETECRSLGEELQRVEKVAKDRESIVNRLTQDLQDSRRKIQLLQSEVDQKTDELAAMDTDVRKAVLDYNQLKEKHKKDLEKYQLNFEAKMGEELDKLAKHLNENHKKQADALQSQIIKLENEREMLFGKLEDYKSHAEDFRRENEYLKRNAKQIKQDLLAQCQRRVFSVLNYDSQSSDSPPPARYAPLARTRSRSVTFPDEPRELSENAHVSEPPPARTAPTSTRTVPPSARPAPPPPEFEVRKRPTSFIRRA